MFLLLDCPEGYYGDECKEICGHCKNSTICHHINGTCIHGCEPGYIGDYCDIGMENENP